MKSLSDTPSSIQNTVVILRCRGLELDSKDRQELHRSEVAFGHVFHRIHRIEWKLIANPDSVELRCEIRAASGNFSATAFGANARAVLQSVTEKILKQKRRAKTTAVTRRRAAPAARRAPSK